MNIKKHLLFLLLASILLSANSNDFKVNSISYKIKNRMIKGNSWRKGCPVPLKDLRYLTIKHKNFYGTDKRGELIVHKDVAYNVIKIFKELYAINYPIKQMRLVSDFRGSDFQSIEADNTSALNCRSITGNKRKWSKHAFGKAIDINPIENPYISRRGHISHRGSHKYRVRKHRNYYSSRDRAILLKRDRATKIFEKYGWNWGGDWRSIKDYQHFEYKHKIRKKAKRKSYKYNRNLKKKVKIYQQAMIVPVPVAIPENIKVIKVIKKKILPIKVKKKEKYLTFDEILKLF